MPKHKQPQQRFGTLQRGFSDTVRWRVRQQDPCGFDRMLRWMLTSRHQCILRPAIVLQAGCPALHEATGPRAETSFVTFVGLGGSLDDVSHSEHGLIRDADFTLQIRKRRQRLRLNAAKRQRLFRAPPC